MNKKIGRENNFNLLRFFFASLVIISHVPELQDGNRKNEILTQIFHTISFGEMAVDSFFVLSGFLIVKSWQERPRIGAFLSSRILRIYPGFIASSLLCAFIIGPIYGSTNYFQYFELLKFFSGLVKLNLEVTPTVFQNSPYPTLNGAIWTIPYEFKCYLLALACGFVGGFKKRWVVLAFFLACASIHMINRLGAFQLPFDVYFRCGMAFSAGATFYLYRHEIIWSREIVFAALIALIGLLFIKPFAEIALCAFWGYAIIYFAISGTRFLEFNRLPDVSYGIYLYAWPINKIILWHYPKMNVYVAIALVFLFSIVCGVASWFIIEKPFMKLKKLFRQRSVHLAHSAT